jgi:DNA-binding response OmpR family regulator
MKILVADDDPSFRHLLEDVLVKWGYEPVAARDGNEAWHALQDAEPAQIAILDWKMPGMEGVDICRRVRKERQEAYTYIILLTFQGREEDIVAGMEAGADDYIHKPLKTNELRVRLAAGKRIVELRNELVVARRTGAEQAAELENLTRELERFGTVVSQELLAPLTRIRTDSQLLQEVLCRLDNTQCESFATKINDETVHMDRLVNDMLAVLSRMRQRAEQVIHPGTACAKERNDERTG